MTKPDRTRKDLPRPKHPKKWLGRVVRRQYLTLLARANELAEEWEIREKIRAGKRAQGRRPQAKVIRDRHKEREAACEARRQLTTKRERDASGRFLAKCRTRQSPVPAA